MMEITVKDTNAAEHYVDHYKIQWELNTRKVNKQFFVRILLYGGLVVLGLLGMIFDKHNSNAIVQIPMDVIVMTLGVTVILITFNTKRAYAKYNSENQTYVQKSSELIRKGDNTLTIKLTDDSIQIEHYGNFEKVSWNYFTNYSIEQDLIIFHKNPKAIDHFVVRKELLTGDEYDELLFFCNENLKRHVY